ncbi:MAG: SRPBCC domain-containing protein [Rhizobiales bacterium]|nr:SRPBCC domain-containing protein [Hyphomicrobiales bacterium]
MTADDQQTFTIGRVLDAPRSLVYRCFTDPERMQHWWGPKGVTIVKSAMDLRVGGIYHYGMKTPDGKPVWGRFVYRQIVAPEKLVFINSFSDETGGLTRHPFAENWPLEMLSTFLFEELPGVKTKFTVQWQPWNATEEERAVFAAGHASMTGGWSGTLEQLEAYLATVRG